MQCLPQQSWCVNFCRASLWARQRLADPGENCVGDRLHDATASPVRATRVGGRGLVLHCCSVWRWCPNEEAGCKTDTPPASPVECHPSHPTTPNHTHATTHTAYRADACTCRNAGVWHVYAGRQTLRQDCRRLPSLPSAGSEDPSLPSDDRVTQIVHLRVPADRRR